MTELENDILCYYRRAAHPARQVRFIGQLVGRDVAFVLEVLKKYKKIPPNTTVKNYKALLGNIAPVLGPSEERQRYIVGSLKDVRTIARELKMPREEVEKIRREAMKKARRKNER